MRERDGRVGLDGSAGSEIRFIAKGISASIQGHFSHGQVDQSRSQAKAPRHISSGPKLDSWLLLANARRNYG